MTIWEKVFESIETRIVRKSVLPRKAKVTMRIGPRMRWKSTLRVTPVPSSPNQIHNIHLAMVIGEGSFSSLTLLRQRLSQDMARRNPKKHQAATRVRMRKSPSIALREMKSMFSGMRLKAMRGKMTGAAHARMSRA